HQCRALVMGNPRLMLPRILLGPLVAAAVCTGKTSGTTNRSCAAFTVPEPAPPPAFNHSVLTLLLEVDSLGQILAISARPSTNSLVKMKAVANVYHDPYVHPSEPNYVWMVSGQTFGVLDDADPASHHLDSTSHLVDQLELADLTWKSYQEGMGAACGLVSHDR